jgi:hypothetical protein
VRTEDCACIELMLVLITDMDYLLGKGY